MNARLTHWLGRASPLLVLAPHPDDDVLGCGRLIQQADDGGGVVIVWLTDGGASHGALAPHARAVLVRRRRAEALAGVHALGVRPVAAYFLGHRDGMLAQSHDQARAAVEHIRRRHGIRTVAVTDRRDGHPDHRAAYAIAAGLGAARILSYPVSTRFDGDAYAPPPGALRLAAPPGDRKRAALLKHRSQMEARALTRLSLAKIARFCTDPEFFLPIRRSRYAR